MKLRFAKSNEPFVLIAKLIRLISKIDSPLFRTKQQELELMEAKARDGIIMNLEIPTPGKGKKVD